MTVKPRAAVWSWHNSGGEEDRFWHLGCPVETGCGQLGINYLQVVGGGGCTPASLWRAGEGPFGCSCVQTPGMLWQTCLKKQLQFLGAVVVPEYLAVSSGLLWVRALGKQGWQEGEIGLSWPRVGAGEESGCPPWSLDGVPSS